MKSADLPKEKASEPKEEARQPSPETKMPPHGQNPKKLTFAENVDFTTSSQRSSSYKDVLSQPPAEISHKQKMLWLQKRRTAGLWAQCDDCDRWRFLHDVLDRQELPKKWYCWMNADKEFASCSVPEAPLRLHDEEDLIHSEYAAGSLVWARLDGWPWWPAMVDDCPDAEQYYWLDGFSDIPTHYNVVFFDNMEVTRAWIAPDQLRPFSSNKNMSNNLLKNKKYNSRLKAAMAQANEAEKIPLDIRLARFSFTARYMGTIKSPKKIKKHDVMKYQRQFKRKFNIDFPIESSESDEDINNDNEHSSKNNNNVIMLGTPKRAKRDKSHIPKKLAIVNECNVPAENNNAIPNNSEPKNLNTEESVDKPSNSMAVQVGSTEVESIDNDTSATYVPENATQPSETEFSIRIDTPSSDFEHSSKNNNNVIMLGTPKRAKRDKSHIPNKLAIVNECNVPAENNNAIPNNSEPKNLNTEESVDKPSNSMAVQVGSTEVESIDNDTSATYVPENATQPSETEFSIRIDTPSSDFDF